MDFAQTEDQRVLCEEIVRFAKKELNDDVIGRDRDHRFSRDLWVKMGEMGLQGLPVPEELGGTGLDSVTTAMALEALGYGCSDGGLVFALSAHLLACVIPVWKHGTDEQKARYFPGLVDGSLIAVNGMTEPQSGSDTFGSMATRAERVDGGWKLNGVKTFSSNGPVADIAIVYGLTDKAKGYFGGVTGFLVDTDSPGFEVGQTFEKMGLRTATISELVLEDCFVPDENVLGGIGGGSSIFTESMEWERACLAATHVGKIQKLLDMAVKYAKTRKSGGQAIGKYQAIAHKVADMQIQLDAARLLTMRGAWSLEHSRMISMHSSISKVFVSEALIKAALDTVQVFGGYGFMVDYEVERYLRDSISGTIYSGANEVQRNIIARWAGL